MIARTVPSDFEEWMALYFKKLIAANEKGAFIKTVEKIDSSHRLQNY